MSKRTELTLRTSALALLACGLCACSLTHLPTNVEPEAPLSASTEQAGRKLELARLERAAIEGRYGADEQVCYTKFFVNNCLDVAKEKRRSALATQRAIELEAEYFLRKSKADQRDRELAQAAQEFAASEAAFAAAQAAAPAAAPGAAAGATAGKGANPANAATAPKAPKLPKPPRGPKAPPTAAELQAEAAERAENVVAYQKRQAALAERQRRVAEKKAKRAAKEAAKQR